MRLDGVDQDCNGHDLTIAVSKAVFTAVESSLRVEATSALAGGALLRVDGLGDMSWKNGKWTYDAGPIANPGVVTVCGVEGCTPAQVTVE